MSEFAFAPPPQPFLNIENSPQKFPVRRVFCVGRNFGDHAREMGANPDREPPFFFSKPADALVPGDGKNPLKIGYPRATADLHHEVELVIGLHKGGADIDPADAKEMIFAAAVGIDFTRRDIQAEAKKMNRPWDMAKGFDNSGPIGPLRPLADMSSLQAGLIQLTVNGETRQQGDLNQMIWPVADIIATLSKLITLAPGDVIFTGTPAGVGAVKAGDFLEARISDLPPLDIAISA